MMSRLFRFLSLACIVALLGAAFPAAFAQDGQRYENPGLGVAFDLPAGWEVTEKNNSLIAATPADLTLAQAGDSPQGLTLRIVIGSFNELGITDAGELPDLLTRLVSSEATPTQAEPIQWGSVSGYHMVATIPDANLTTRVALLAIPGGRVAVVRGLAPTTDWDGGAGAQFDTLAQSLVFSLPVSDQDFIQQITSNDGGVFWHFQSPQPDSGRVVQAGGITYDMFDVMYVAAGPGGLLALNMPVGEQISYMGPWINGNFVDIAIGPDTRLYLANNADDSQNAIMVADRAGNYARGWGIRGNADGEFAPGMPLTIAVTTNSEVWTVSEGHTEGVRNRLYKFDIWGNLLLTVDLDTINPELSGIHIELNQDTGSLYLVGATGNLNVVDPDGQALVVNLAQEVLAGVTPIDITISPEDNIILALPAPGLDGFGLLEFSVSGHLLDAFGFPYDTARGGPFLPGEYLRPGGLAVGTDGLIYWAETNPDGYIQVQKFSFRGDGALPLGNETVEEAPDPAETVLAADPAQGGGAISYGQSVRSSLNNRYPVHNWTFEGQAGDHIIITMIDASGEGLLDPLVSLATADERVIASNDDVGAGAKEGMSARDAYLEFDLPSTGNFIIQATRFGGRGEYILTLEVGG